MWYIVSHYSDGVITMRELTENDATPHIVCNSMIYLSCDRLYENSMCLYLLQILVGVEVCGRMQLARHIYLLYLYNMHVPYNGTWYICTHILLVDLAQLFLAFRIYNLT